MTYRDRNDHYVPDGLNFGGPPFYVEVAPPRDNLPVLAREAFVAPDELNPDSRWRWADVSGDGSHWSRFDGHQVQLDVELHTDNRREVNAWKGRDEIRAEGIWTLHLNREQVWEGFVRRNPLDQLLEIRRIAQTLIDHDAINWRTGRSVADQLLGRRVFYDRTPAVVSSVSVLSQGCVMLKPVGITEFPPHISTVDTGEEDYWDRDEIKAELLSPHVWWWRDVPAGDEADLRPKPGPEAEAKAMH